ncbi:MAG: radical SAM protein [Deltaproteobacteria bacterium]|nr:radical SAM protein [Deltaproteobacteria bacterium]
MATSARILGECIELGALNINFTGGEALMRREIYDLIGAAQPDRVVVSLATNGMMLSDDVVRRLKESGVRILSVGLDSARPEVHDARKARVGAYEKLVAGVKRAVSLDLEVYLLHRHHPREPRQRRRVGDGRAVAEPRLPADREHRVFGGGVEGRPGPAPAPARDPRVRADARGAARALGRRLELPEGGLPGGDREDLRHGHRGSGAVPTRPRLVRQRAHRADVGDLAAHAR